MTTTTRTNTRRSVRLGLGVAALSLVAAACADDDTLLEQHEDRLEKIDVAGDTIAYLDHGDEDAEPIILLHGIPTSSFLYRDIAPDLAESTGRRVIAPDLLGFGASDKPDRDGAYTVDAQAERIFDFVDALDIDTFTLGVHDIGGFVGWSMIDQQPDRLDALLVTNTSAYGEGLMPAPRTVAIATGEQTPEEAWRSLDDPEFATTITREFLEIGFADPGDVSDELVDAYAERLDEGTSEAFVQFFTDIFPELAAEPERRANFQEFDAPVLVLHGAEDRFFAADTVTSLFAEDFELDPVDVVIVPGAGHYIQEDDPDTYVDEVTRFLDTE